MAIVDRDIKDASEGEISTDWSFGIAYNAALNISSFINNEDMPPLLLLNINLLVHNQNDGLNHDMYEDPSQGSTDLQEEHPS